MQCSLLAALYAGEDDNSKAGISLTLAQSFFSLPLPPAGVPGLLVHMLLAKLAQESD